MANVCTYRTQLSISFKYIRIKKAKQKFYFKNNLIRLHIGVTSFLSGSSLFGESKIESQDRISNQMSMLISFLKKQRDLY